MVRAITPAKLMMAVNLGCLIRKSIARTSVISFCAVELRGGITRAKAYEWEVQGGLKRELEGVGADRYKDVQKGAGGMKGGNGGDRDRRRRRWRPEATPVTS
jgi:hypothetical protein